MKIAGIDIGTTGCKISIYDEDGSFLSERYLEYKAAQTKIGYEIDAAEIWNSVQIVIRQSVQDTCGLKAIGITSFGETAVLLDENDKPLLNALLYTDERGSEQCNQLIERFGKLHISEITGVNPNAMYTLPKLMWIKQNLPNAYANAKRILQMQDYIVYMLTGIAQIDYSLASRSMAFDIAALKWCHELLDFAGIDEKLLSHPVPTGTKAGVIRRSIAESLGLSPDVEIVSVSHDQVAAAVGSGILQLGMAVDGTGTVECIAPIYEGIPDSELIQRGSYAVVPYVLPNTYISYAFSFTGGALLKWYRDNLVSKREEGGSAYESFNAQVSDEPSGLLVLPHFAGAATPYMNNKAKGAILGLTVDTKAIDIYRALMEGVTYEMLLNIEYLNEANIEISGLRATGGGASSSVWLQMKADILNIPVTTLGTAQSGTLGCVMLAGVACGLYDTLQAACDRFITIGKTYYPRAHHHEQYMPLYAKYKKLYGAVREVLEY